MNALEQLPFFKMCGSGNDFVFFDGRALDIVSLLDASAIQALCARATGIGADGVVVLEPGDAAANVRIHYFNSDGSRASLCGNATLCAARLAAELGAVDPRRFTIATDAGVLPARIRRDGVPEIEFRPVTDVRPSAGIAAESVEGRIGFALAGVPHLVVEVDAVDSVDLDRRGRALRFDSSLEAGANVNFVSRLTSHSWRMRTYERGVEGETLACGTGAVATATVLGAWGAATADETEVVTSSGRSLIVGRGSDARGPSLAGEGRIVFRGRLEHFR